MDGTLSIRKRSWIGWAQSLALVGLLGLVACSQETPATDTQSGLKGKDTQPPTLVSSTPQNGARNVSLNLPAASFTFSEAVQPDSIKLACSYTPAENSVMTQCGLGGSASFISPETKDNKTFVSKRTGKALVAGATYRLEIIGAKDKAGNVMPDTAISFQVESLTPTLVSSIPAHGATNVPNQLSEVRFNFDKSMDTASFRVKCLSNTEPCNSDIAHLLGTPNWSDENRTVVFTPTRALLELFTYGLMLEGKAQNEVALESTPVVFTTTDMPRLIRYIPAEGSVGNASRGRISLTFHKQMDTASLRSAISGTVSAWDGSSFRSLVISDIKVSQSQGGEYEYIFIPDQPHGDAKVVVWVLGRGAKDTYGNPIPEILSGGFRTARRFTVTLPADPHFTGMVYRHCIFPGCDNHARERASIVVGYSGSKPTLGLESTHVYRGAIGFRYPDTFPANAQFDKATLTVEQSEIGGTPFAADKLTSMAFERVNYGIKLDGSDFDTQSLPCFGQPCAAKFYGPPDPVDGPVDVLNYFLADWVDRDTRGYQSHFRLRFANNRPISGGTLQTQWIFYQPSATLTIEYLAP